MQTALSNLDLAIVGVYFVVVIAKGLQVAFHTHTDEDLFLAGRSLRFGPIGLSLFASNISSTTLIGLAGAAYTAGIAMANYEWMAGLVLVVMAVVFIPLYLKARVVTVPEFLARRFDRRSRLYFSAWTIFLTVFVDTAGSLYAGALVIMVFFPSFTLLETVAGVAIFSGVYTAAGGLKAVVQTDAIQAIVLIIGSCIITWTLFGDFDHRWANVVDFLPPDRLSLFRPLDDAQLPWLGTLTGVPILGFWYWATNQYIAQRVLGAQDMKHARAGAMLGGALKLLPLFIMVLPGAMALKRFPNLANSDFVFPTLVLHALPVGAIGLVMAGLFAAIMSSVDSALNSASTLLIHDFTRHDDAPKDSKRQLRIGRIATLCFMALASLWAPMIQNFEGLFAYLQQAFAIVVPPVVAIFILGGMTRRGSGQTAWITLLSGHAVAAVFFVLSKTGYWSWHYTLTAGLTTAISFVIYLVAARFTPAPSDEVVERYVFHRAWARPEPGDFWLWDYRIWATMVVAATLATVAAFA